MVILRKGKKALREELSHLEADEESAALTPDAFKRKTEILVELHAIYADEELFWLQRSHERWLLQGDCNTSYLHRVANGRKRKNFVHSLKSGYLVIEGTKNLLDHATSFFKEFFWAGTPGSNW
jgi:hypothetical protein